MKKIVLGIVTVVLVTGIGTAIVIAKENGVLDTLSTKLSGEKTNKSPDTAEEKADQAPEFVTETFAGNSFEAISANPELSTFVTALNKTGLAEKLKEKGPVTIFAPNNEAFTKLPEGFLDTMMEQNAAPVLESILSYHIVPGKILTMHLTQEETPVASLQSRPVTLKKTPEGVLFNGALITEPDLQTTNGVVHIINTIDLNPQAVVPVMTQSSGEEPPAAEPSETAAPAEAPQEAPAADTEKEPATATAPAAQ
ncbi:MAG: fasciclin domain-containing protein [Alphaproteobacteria bacterium]|nr:fasciclin domain-containing protein [Alphaproteobacteria bacterium]MCD8570194.1 fasciclin domain-containing protein [Alphaproteobacteria bacterium]